MIKQNNLQRILVTVFLCLFAHQLFAFSLSSLSSFFSFSHDKPVKLRVNHHPKNQKQPMHIKVGVYALHVGRYDLQSASIRVDFYLILRCKPFCNNVNFEIMNSTNSTMNLITKQKDSLVYRIQADVSKTDSLRSYPFDNHTVDIVLENRQWTSDEMIFEVDPTMSALDSNLNVVGFEFSPIWTATVTNHYYKVFQQTFSSYKFSMSIKRPWLAGIIKGILPALIIILCSFLALFLKLGHLSQRLSVTTSALIASVVFHLNLTGSLPPLGYVTYADMLMFINYFSLLLILISVIVTTHLTETTHNELAERVNKISAWTIPSTWFGLQLINWFVFNPI